MSKVGTETLRCRINNVIAIHRTAQDITIAEVIGLLEIMKLDLYNEVAESDDYGSEVEYGQG